MSNNYFACKTDKVPHSYRCGETATLTLSFRNEGKTVSAPAFKWQIKADFGFKDEGIVDGKNGEFSLTATMDKPGFVYVTAQAVDENGVQAPPRPFQEDLDPADKVHRHAPPRRYNEPNDKRCRKYL